MRHLHDDICHENALMGIFSDVILFLCYPNNTTGQSKRPLLIIPGSFAFHHINPNRTNCSFGASFSFIRRIIPSIIRRSSSGFETGFT